MKGGNKMQIQRLNFLIKVYSITVPEMFGYSVQTNVYSVTDRTLHTSTSGSTPRTMTVLLLVGKREKRVL
jgi:hypothetical protein